MSKKISITSLFFILVLVLAACGPGNNTANNEDLGASPDMNATANVTGEPIETDSPEMMGTNTPEVSLPETGGTATAPAATLPAATAVVETTEAPTPEATRSIDTGATPETGATLPAGTPGAQQEDSQLRGAEIIPPTGRNQVTQLSALLGYQLMDANGQTVGSISDYIVNMCEAHIIYMVVDADASLNLDGGSRMLIPYEVVTLGGGSIDTEQEAIILAQGSDQVTAAPTFDGTLDLTTTDWETDVRGYWNDIVTLSNLTTGCRVPPAGGQGQEGSQPTASAPEGTVSPEATQGAGEGSQVVNVTKIAYASDILGTQLESGNGNALGTVEDAVIVPESGLLRYVVLQPGEGLQNMPGLVLVPMGAVNIRDEAQESGEGALLVLLVEEDVLMNAPSVDAVPDTSQAGWEDESRQYWSQYVTMGDEDSADQSQP